jgi:hypothetical protein
LEAIVLRRFLEIMAVESVEEIFMEVRSEAQTEWYLPSVTS